jgi:hypothetical protein
MASNDYLVYVPDRSSAFRFPRTMVPEEVRASLVATGHTAIETSELVLSADGGTITFRRATGGTKGL